VLALGEALGATLGGGLVAGDAVGVGVGVAGTASSLLRLPLPEQPITESNTSTGRRFTPQSYSIAAGSSWHRHAGKFRISPCTVLAGG